MGEPRENMGRRRLAKDLATVAPALKSDAEGREVFLYVISGHKERNPAAAMALIERLSS